MVCVFCKSIVLRDEKQKNFQYPSITVCPEKTFKTSKRIPKSGTLEDIRQFYLDNVRTLDEVFFFVNQRTWSRDGHKCMTGKVSEDPGRPCIFPFTTRNETHLKCVMPDTWVTVVKLRLNSHCLWTLCIFAAWKLSSPSTSPDPPSPFSPDQVW